MASQAKARVGEENPYLAGRRGWNERYGDFIARESRWRMLAMICAATTLFSVGGIAWIGSRSKLVPYLVTMDPSGNALVGHLAQQTPADDNVVDRKSTRLNSSHRCISYAVFCLRIK